jgi:hypothetical protein
MNSNWARDLANQLYNGNQRDIRVANARTEQDRNQALGAVDQFRQQNFGIPQATIDRDTQTMLGATQQFRDYRPTTSYGPDQAFDDRDATLGQAQAIAGSQRPMQDRADMIGLIQEFDAREADIPDRARDDRALMVRELASYAAKNQGIPQQEKDQILGDLEQREAAQNAQNMEALRQNLANQGVVLSPWAMAQVGARMSLATNDRISAKTIELEMQDRQMKDAASRFHVSAMSQVLDSTRADEMASAQLRESLEANNDAASLQLYDQLYTTTRQDETNNQIAGAQISANARSTAGSLAQSADGLREQLQLSRDTAGLEMLDRVLATGRDETRQNGTTAMTQQGMADQLLYQILSGTEYQTADMGQMAGLVSMLAKGA